ncbi:MAG: M24 family metallopeptidase [Bacillota bacterium]
MDRSAFEGRRWRLAAAAERQGLDGVVVPPGANLLYLTGLRMTASERPTMAVVSGDGGLAVVAPRLEVERVRRETGVEKVHEYGDEDDPLGAVRSALRQVFPAVSTGRALRLGMEYLNLRLFEYRLLDEAVPELVPSDAGPLMTDLRRRKDPAEVVLIEKAVAVVERATRAARGAVRPGASELDVARAIEAAIREDELATGGGTVASGERSAMPHARTSPRTIRDGEVVWADIVVVREGYVADITRTFATGPLGPELNRVYDVVLEAQRRAREGSRPGMTGAELDAMARDYITGQGFGEYFTHRTGHGLGLEVHEEPYIVRGNDRPLEPGQVFTIEPGVYLPGKGGVRVEDDILLTEEGPRSLTSYPRDLRLGQSG